MVRFNDIWAFFKRSQFWSILQLSWQFEKIILYGFKKRKQLEILGSFCKIILRGMIIIILSVQKPIPQTFMDM